MMIGRDFPHKELDPIERQVDELYDERVDPKQLGRLALILELVRKDTEDDDTPMP